MLNQAHNVLQLKKYSAHEYAGSLWLHFIENHTYLIKSFSDKNHNLSTLSTLPSVCVCLLAKKKDN